MKPNSLKSNGCGCGERDIVMTQRAPPDPDLDSFGNLDSALKIPYCWIHWNCLAQTRQRHLKKVRHRMRKDVGVSGKTFAEIDLYKARKFVLAGDDLAMCPVETRSDARPSKKLALHRTACFGHEQISVCSHARAIISQSFPLVTDCRAEDARWWSARGYKLGRR